MHSTYYQTKTKHKYHVFKYFKYDRKIKNVLLVMVHPKTIENKLFSILTINDLSIMMIVS